MWTKGNFLLICIKIKRFRIWIPVAIYIARELLWQVLEMAEIFKPVITDRKTKAHVKKGLAAIPELMKVLYLIGEDGRFDLVDIEASDEKGEDVKISIKVW